MVFLRDVFRQNRYNDRQIYRVLNHCLDINQPYSNPDLAAFLPCVRTIFNRIGRVLSRYSIISLGLPPKKVSSFLQPVKHNFGLKTLGV
jgi:hypothetical protein